MRERQREEGRGGGEGRKGERERGEEKEEERGEIERGKMTQWHQVEVLPVPLLCSQLKWLLFLLVDLQKQYFITHETVVAAAVHITVAIQLTHHCMTFKITRHL